MANKARLGRGLGALIPEMEDPISNDTITAPTRNANSIQQIKISKIVANPFQPRLEFERGALEELKKSIAEKGLIQPVTVRRMPDGTYQLIAGERRFRSTTELGYTEIPAYILDVETDEDMLELSLIENIQREQLNAIEVALGFQRLIDECHLTQEEVAQKVSKERSTVTNFLRLLKLPEPIQGSVARKELTMGHARALVTIEEKTKQMDIWQKILAEHLSVRKVEALVKKVTDPPAEKRPKKDVDIPVYVRNAEDKLRQILATQVRIVMSKGGDVGKVEIEFYSRDELEGLLNKLDVY
ncbi:ParB/RepB/Spo0J family partition protein [bacterium]|nr:ParB/RepB/Spo0J family partition protein [bacterium]